MQKHSIFLLLLLLDAAAGCNDPGDYKFTCSATCRDSTPAAPPRTRASIGLQSLFRRFAVFDGLYADKEVAQHYWIAKAEGIFYYNNVEQVVSEALPCLKLYYQI
ncbi:hypothetical protein M569_03985 [Genlisea aurea]|uniref:Uncharacterized protein n=1 Tax=Genlisea aurea TaxID=192259 RepID=S8CVE8_9LAMI|nr:hypothetical protein M569_03985 [Genlisea aurea]